MVCWLVPPYNASFLLAKTRRDIGAARRLVEEDYWYRGHRVDGKLTGADVVQLSLGCTVGY